MKIALYIRVSTDEQIEKYGIPMQKERLLALIKSKGVAEDRRDIFRLAGENYIYVDGGVSGTVPLDERPAFRQLKEDILMSSKDKRPFDAVAVYRLDRLARRLRILLDVVDLFDNNNIQLISATEPIDTTHPFGRAVLSIIGTVAELEIEVTKERTQSGKITAKRLGKIMGTNAKYGYKKDERNFAVVFEEEASVVRDIFYQFVQQRLSREEIAKNLEFKKIRTPDASALFYKKREGFSKKKYSEFFWRASSITKILQDEYYIGRSYVNQQKDGKKLSKDKWELIECGHPSIVDLVTFEKAQRLLIKPVEPQKKTGRLYLLRSLLRCDHCKEIDQLSGNITYINWNGTSKNMRNGRYTYSYICGRKNSRKFPTSCNTLPLNADAIEDYIIRFIKQLLKDPKAVYTHQQGLKSSEVELNHLNKRKKELIKFIDSTTGFVERLKTQNIQNIITMDELKIRLNEVDISKLKAQEELRDVERGINKSIINEDYEKVLTTFQKFYEKTLGNISKNKEELYKILHILIEDITIYSRELTSEDKKVAGRKKEGNQFIPYKLHIRLRLPKDILQNLIANPIKFESVPSDTNELNVGIEPNNAELDDTKDTRFQVEKSQWWAICQDVRTIYFVKLVRNS